MRLIEYLAPERIGFRSGVKVPSRVVAETLMLYHRVIDTVDGLIARSDKSALKFCECAEICEIVELADDCLPCCRTAEEGHSQRCES